jgi:hypothetical protein
MSAPFQTSDLHNSTEQLLASLSSGGGGKPALARSAARVIISTAGSASSAGEIPDDVDLGEKLTTFLKKADLQTVTMKQARKVGAACK